MSTDTNNSSANNGVGLFVALSLVGFLVYRNVGNTFEIPNVTGADSSSFWPKPTTHMGWVFKAIDKKSLSQIRKDPPPLLATIFHTAAKKVIVVTNGSRKYWSIAFVLLIGSFTFLQKLLFRTRRRESHYILFRVILLFGVVGVIFHFAWAPLSAPWYMNSLSGLFYGVGLFTLAAAFLNSINPFPKDRKRIIQYGPKFCEPYLNGCGSINIAAYEKKVLPEASRWAAKGGRWPVEIQIKKLSSGITILGEKGSGKSRLMFAIHDELRSKYPDVPILIHDPKGEWFRTYYDKTTDLVFGPNIEGSSTWDIWNDLKSHPEMIHGVINTAVYAHPSNGDTFWLDQAVKLLENAFSAPSLMEAQSYLIAKREANIDDKMFLSIYGTAKLALHDIAKVALSKPHKDSDKSPTNIDDYLKWKGRLLLLNNPAFAAEQRGAFSLFLSAFLIRALSLPDVPAGQLRLVAFIDEALTFTLPPEIEKLIYTQCRSKGIVIIAGAQRLPDKNLKETGEWATAENIFAMKVLNLDTQALLSKRAGDISYEEKSKSKQRDQGGQERGASEVSHSRTHSAIPPETFGRLKNRECILFHDAGIAPCKTNLVEREQRDILLPNYTARAEVIEFMKKLD